VDAFTGIRQLKYVAVPEARRSPSRWAAVIEFRPASDRVWSVLPNDGRRERYDPRAAGYDLVVGSRLYNRLLWGSSPRGYSAFAERAILSGSGPLLDAGCGSLVFTAGVYAQASRPLVLVDRSIGMLRAARARLDRAVGDRSERVVFVHGDLRTLPFRGRAFSTVVCMGMLHLFDDVREPVSALTRLATGEAKLFLTSLVAETWIGNGILRFYTPGARSPHRAHEISSLKELRSLVSLDHVACQGSMAFVIGRAAPERGIATIS
jgi:SAM-dependent methyltransferase